MKGIFSILFSLVLLVPSVRISVDRHYCHGELADVKISLSGEKASCGMEETDSPYQGMPVFTGKCCEDHVTLLNLNSGDYPGPSSSGAQFISKDNTGEVTGCFNSSTPDRPVYFSPVNPPGLFPHAGPKQTVLCLFRI